jgi:hypothetical protein
MVAPAAAQTPTTVVGMAPSTEDWGYTLETGVVWGQIFGGLSAQNDKKTFKKLRAEIWYPGRRVTVASRDRSFSPQAPRAAAAQGQPRRAGTIQYGGGIGFSHFGFPEEAQDFFGESGFTVTTIMGGVRYVLPPQPRFMAFVQGQAGLDRSFGDSAFAIAPEAGVIMPVRKNLFLTVTGGFRTAFEEGGSGTGFELGVGLTVPFGHQ